MLLGGQAVGWAASAPLWPLLSSRLAQAYSHKDLRVTRAASTSIVSINVPVLKASVTAKPGFEVEKGCSFGGKDEFVTIYQMHWGEQTTATKREGAMTSSGGTREEFRGEVILESQPGKMNASSSRNVSRCTLCMRQA